MHTQRISTIIFLLFVQMKNSKSTAAMFTEPSCKSGCNMKEIAKLFLEVQLQISKSFETKMTNMKADYNSKMDSMEKQYSARISGLESNMNAMEKKLESEISALAFENRNLSTTVVRLKSEMDNGEKTVTEEFTKRDETLSRHEKQIKSLVDQQQASKHEVEFLKVQISALMDDLNATAKGLIVAEAGLEKVKAQENTLKTNQRILSLEVAALKSGLQTGKQNSDVMEMNQKEMNVTLNNLSTKQVDMDKNLIVATTDQQKLSLRMAMLENQQQNSVNLLKGIPGMTIKRNNLVRILSEFRSEYDISFDIYPTKFANGYHQVLRLTTTTNDCCDPEDRISAIWFHSTLGDEFSRTLHITSDATPSARQIMYNTKRLLVLQWTHVHIKQVFSGGKAVYQVFINYKKVFSTIVEHPKVYKNVKVYVSDPYTYPAQEGMVANLMISSK